MGFGELLLILFLLVLFFGAGKLAGLGAGLGKAARSLKDAVAPQPPAPDARPEPKKELPPKP